LPLDVGVLIFETSANLRFLLEFLDTGGLQMTIQMLTNKKIAEAASCSIPALYAHWLQPVRAGGREAGQNAQLAGVH
jgi:hypothetical protein